MTIQEPPKCARDCKNPAQIKVGARWVCFDCMESEKQDYLQEREDVIVLEAAKIIERRNNNGSNSVSELRA